MTAVDHDGSRKAGVGGEGWRMGGRGRVCPGGGGVVMSSWEGIRSKRLRSSSSGAKGQDGLKYD